MVDFGAGGNSVLAWISGTVFLWQEIMVAQQNAVAIKHFFIKIYLSGKDSVSKMTVDGGRKFNSGVGLIVFQDTGNDPWQCEGTSVE